VTYGITPAPITQDQVEPLDFLRSTLVCLADLDPGMLSYLPTRLDCRAELLASEFNAVSPFEAESMFFECILDVHRSCLAMMGQMRLVCGYWFEVDLSINAHTRIYREGRLTKCGRYRRVHVRTIKVARDPITAAGIGLITVWSHYLEVVQGKSAAFQAGGGQEPSG